MYGLVRLLTDTVHNLPCCIDWSLKCCLQHRSCKPLTSQGVFYAPAPQLVRVPHWTKGLMVICKICWIWLKVYWITIDDCSFKWPTWIMHVLPNRGLQSVPRQRKWGDCITRLPKHLDSMMHVFFCHVELNWRKWLDVHMNIFDNCNFYGNCFPIKSTALGQIEKKRKCWVGTASLA